MKSHEIQPNIGVGELKFGITKSEVISVLGFPEEDDRENDEWWYDAIDISLSFNEGNLNSIEILNNELTLFNKLISNLSLNEVCSLLTKHNHNFQIKEEESEEVVCCEKEGLFFVFTDNKLNYIQLIDLK